MFIFNHLFFSECGYYAVDNVKPFTHGEKYLKSFNFLCGEKQNAHEGRINRIIATANAGVFDASISI